MTSCGENQELKPERELLFFGKSRLTSIEITEVWKKSEPLIVSHGRSLDVLSLFGTPSSTAHSLSIQGRGMLILTEW